MAVLNLNSNVGMGFIVAAIGGVWGLYMFLAPIFTQVSTNNIMLENERERSDLIFKAFKSRIMEIEKDQKTYNQHMQQISNDLSEIKGALKARSNK